MMATLSGEKSGRRSGIAVQEWGGWGGRGGGPQSPQSAGKNTARSRGRPRAARLPLNCRHANEPAFSIARSWPPARFTKISAATTTSLQPRTAASGWRSPRSGRRSASSGCGSAARAAGSGSARVRRFSRSRRSGRRRSAPLNRLWARFGRLLHRLVTPLLMLIVFAATVVPIGLAMRALGKGPLRRRPDPAAQSYWIERRPPGPPPETMKNQF